MTGDIGHAEDLVQSAMVKAYGSWSRVSAAEDMDAYVMRIVLNTDKNRFRKRRAAGHPWSFSVGIIAGEKKFEQEHPELFDTGGAGYQDIPYAHYFHSFDRFSPMWTMDEDLGYHDGDAKTQPLGGLHVETIGTADSHGIYPAALLFGKAEKSDVDHVDVVYAHHTDTLKPVVVNAVKFFATATATSDEPQQVVTYDVSGNVLERDTSITQTWDVLTHV